MFVYESTDVLDARGAFFLVGADAIVGVGTVAGETTVRAGVGAWRTIPLETIGLGDRCGEVGFGHTQVDVKTEDQRGQDE
jgi:hypothetical protein